MALSDLSPILHKIRVRLYPNFLQNVQGAYIARTFNEKSLSIEDVCTALKTRGGFTGNYDELVEHVRQYYEEVAYQLCDGYAVNNGYYAIHPNIGGTFDSVNEGHDHGRHPISFRFGIRSRLKSLLRNIEVTMEGLADTSGYIDTFRDFEEDSVNSLFAPGNQLAIHGHKIKILGEDPSNGLYFVPEGDPSKAVKAARIAENSGSNITGIIPELGPGAYRLEIRTQYSGSSTILAKTPRAVRSVFTLEKG